MENNIIEKQWTNFKNRLKIQNQPLLADLNPPATDATISLIEEKIGIKLPMDFIHCLKVHDGQKGKQEGLFSGLEFLSSTRILAEWMVWQRLFENGDFDGFQVQSGAGIQPVWWNPRWIPFTYNGMGDHLCLDLDPASGGQVGQVIAIWHDDGARKKKADNFAQWFEMVVDQTV